MKDKIKIFWCASSDDQKMDWNILYYKPDFLFNELKNNKVENLQHKDNLFFCPVVRNLISKTIVIKNTINSHYKFTKDKNDSYSYEVLSKDHMAINFDHPSNLKNCVLFTYLMPFLFFSEEDINMTLTSPYFSNSPHLQYGAMVPGKFNISKWFRPINFEFNLWENINEFKINKNEDIAYINFETTKEIELIRFYNTDKIQKICNTLATSSVWEKFIPLKERYERFKRSQMNKLIVEEIKKNIIE